MFENPKRGRQARHFTTNVPKILVLKWSSEPIFPKNSRWVPLKALWRKWHFPLMSIHLKCKDWRRYKRKQRLKNCPNGQVMAILGRSHKTRTFRKSAKGRPREVFQKSPKQQPLLQWANSTLAQTSLSCKLYPLITQRLKKIFAQKAAPKLPEWPSYGNFRKVTQKPHFLKKCKGGTKGNFSKIAQKDALA